MKKVLYLFAILFLAACDSVSVDEIIQGAPEIEAFTPGEGTIGNEIIVTGKRLNDVVSATIGGEEVVLAQKVSDTRLSLKVTDNAKSGVITLTNAYGTGTSEASFNILYTAPQPQASSIQQQLEMGKNLLISGQNMNVISSVIFTAVGSTTGHEAQIVQQSSDEILVVIPYVEVDDARITMRYFDGTQYVETAPSLLPVVKIKRDKPEVTTTVFPSAKVGDLVTLEGSYLDKVNEILVGGTPATIVSQTGDRLSFRVPDGDYAEGDNFRTLSMVFFDGQGTELLTDQFRIVVPFVYYWGGRTTYAQARSVPEFVSFFTPENGICHANDEWRTVIDPVSYKYQAATCSKANTPAVTVEEYNSVSPYFFFMGLSAGQLSLYSPGASKTQLKNIYFFNNSSNEYRVTGANADCWGTPALGFMYLDPNNAQHAAIIGKVKDGTLNVINESDFPLSVADNTLCGFSISGVSATLNSDKFAPGVFAPGQEKTADLNSVVLVLYYNHNGMGDIRAENVKRMGLLYIRTVDFRMGSGSNPSASSVTFDMYWQKQDYDYSKVK